MLTEDEFRRILIGPKISTEKQSLSNPSSSVHSSSLSGNELQEDYALPREWIIRLASIGMSMRSRGYRGDFAEAYASVRRPLMQRKFERLGIKKLSDRDVRRLAWDALAVKIRRWTQAAVICVRSLFAKEKRLCTQIFELLEPDTSASTSTSDKCFMATVQDLAAMLFNFAEAVSVSRRSPPGKMFKILDLRHALADILPDINAIFNSDSSKFIPIQAAKTLFQLAGAAAGILVAFEDAVVHELSTSLGAGETIHPTTRYVMDYVIRLVTRYNKALTQLITTKPSIESRYLGDLTLRDMELVELEVCTPMALHLVWIVVILQFNLKAKSKHCQDESLAHLFMMNNIHYIIQRINSTAELREVVGDYFVERLKGKLQQAVGDYASTWDRTLYPLVHKEAMVGWCFRFRGEAWKVGLRSFYNTFQNAHQTQAPWLVSDVQLRDELHRSILKKLIPAYKSFLDQLGGKESRKYIKYSAEELEKVVLEFFNGQRPISKQLEVSQLKWWKCG